MAKGFVCIKCGTGTLVRSNMKMTPDHRPYCRDEPGCSVRVSDKANARADDKLVIDLRRETAFLRG